nr:MAG TPA: hypothetical protein [Caudoviricetes sp.]
MFVLFILAISFVKAYNIKQGADFAISVRSVPRCSSRRGLFYFRVFNFSTNFQQPKIWAENEFSTFQHFFNIVFNEFSTFLLFRRFNQIKKTYVLVKPAF